MGGLMVTRLSCFEVSLSRARLSWHTCQKISTQCQRLPLPDQRVPEVPQLGHGLEAASPHEVEVLCVAVCGLGAQLAEELLMVTLVTHDTCNIAQ